MNSFLSTLFSRLFVLHEEFSKIFFYYKKYLIYHLSKFPYGAARPVDPDTGFFFSSEFLSNLNPDQKLKNYTVL